MKKLLLVGFLVFLSITGGIVWEFIFKKEEPYFFSYIFKSKEELPSAYYSLPQINLLLLGLDVNWTEQDIMYTKNARTDTIMIALLNFPLHKITILSIPRDTRVLIPGYGYDKINSAYALGGVKLLKETLRNFLGLTVDYYALVKVSGLPKIIDTLGGIQLYVEKDMDYDDNWGHLHIHLKKGWQTLSGDQVIQYTRFRNDAEGDLGRIRRQQQVLKELRGKLISIRNPLTLRQLTKVILNTVETDLTLCQTLEIANLLYKYRDSLLIFTSTLPTYSEYVDGISYQIADPAELKEWSNKYIWGIEEKEAKIKILNGNGIVNTAETLKEILKRNSLQEVEVGNASDFNYSETVIIIPQASSLNYAQHKKVLSILEKILPKAKIEEDTSGEYGGVDFIIILGKDYLSLNKEE